MKTVSKEYYRKDIEGLRAVAVLPVLAFHVGFTAVPGGFVGVDIFLDRTSTRLNSSHRR